MGFFDAIIIMCLVTWVMPDEEGCDVLLEGASGILSEEAGVGCRTMVILGS